MESVNVFDIVDSNDNVKISSLSKKEKDLFFTSLNHYMLALRNNIGLTSYDTFGIEIEVDNINWLNYDIENNVLYKDFIFDRDDTVCYGKEVISPILTDNLSTWKMLSQLLHDLKKFSKISKDCAGHIHIGAHLLNGDLDNYIRFAKLFAAYENVIFRFGYGEYLTERNYFDEYYAPLLGDIYNCNINHFTTKYFKMIFDDYRHSVNFNVSFNEIKECTDIKEGNTIEIRCPNGSLNTVIWQNNINFFIKLIKYANSEEYNEELVIKRLESLYLKKIYCDEKYLYRLLDIDAAIELVDLIFDNNVDKVYFLRQYIKGYKVGEKVLEKAHKFYVDI